MEGDRKYGIETLSTRMGTRAVAFLGEPAKHILQLSSVPARKVSGLQVNCSDNLQSVPENTLERQMECAALCSAARAGLILETSHEHLLRNRHGFNAG